MHPLVFFDTIIVETPQDRIYRRLGYRKGTTVLSPEWEAEVEGYIAEAVSLIRLQGAGIRLPLRKRNENQFVLAGRYGDEVLKSRRLARFLGACDEALLMGATAGREVMQAISADVGGERVTRGVVLDAVASEMVDASLDWIMSYFARELRRENGILTEGRFSAGYGDFLLENQGAMFRLLDLSRLGVRITESFVLIPEKSVTALAGVKAGEKAGLKGS
jgi:hypothetical protein